MAFRLKSYPDFFYFAIVGALLSFVLCVIAAVKSRWWWIFAPVLGVAIVMVVYLIFEIGLGLLK